MLSRVGIAAIQTNAEDTEIIAATSAEFRILLLVLVGGREIGSLSEKPAEFGPHPNQALRELVGHIKRVINAASGLMEFILHLGSLVADPLNRILSGFSDFLHISRHAPPLHSNGPDVAARPETWVV